MAAAAAARVLDWLFAFYFLTHIPITLLIGVPALQPGLYPPAMAKWFTWYITTFKDPLLVNPPAWFRPFQYFEIFPQLFFFPVAVYAFWKGNCKWIRTPAIMYATQTATVVVACLFHVLLADFSDSKIASPQTLQERLTLSAVYIPYLLIPLLILISMLFSPAYNQLEKRKKK